VKAHRDNTRRRRPAKKRIGSKGRNASRKAEAPSEGLPLEFTTDRQRPEASKTPPSVPLAPGSQTDGPPEEIISGIPEDPRKAAARFYGSIAEEWMRESESSQPEVTAEQDARSWDRAFERPLLRRKVATLEKEVRSLRKPAGDKSQPRGFEGLSTKKHDLSRYLDSPKLTVRQRDCLSFKLEYELPVAEIARRLNCNRKTVYGHLEAGERALQRDKYLEQRARKRAIDPGRQDK
jgi:DNA-binding CsgD family transcriptional regulator